jgi:S1-C subfamily serine protease
MEKMIRLVLALGCAGAFSFSNAFATPDTAIQLGGRSGPVSTFMGDVDNYQIGDVWGKLPLDAGQVRSGSAVLRKAARATARYAGLMGGATGFYMGKFNGQHIMGTNHHVVDGVGCRNVRLIFPFLGTNGVTVKCKRIIGHWTDADFGLIVLDIPASQESLFNGVGVNFAYDKKIEHGTPLLTVGFGIAKNPGQRNMMVNQDNDCKVYSATGDYRLMGDPDTINPGPYKAWSFAHGCDISHGDSGSAFFDRNTGEMVGIVWTAATPKDPRVLTRDYLDHLDSSSEEIWTKLGYTVPATKIGDVLKSIEPSLPADDAKTVEAILNH